MKIKYIKKATCLGLADGYSVSADLILLLTLAFCLALSEFLTLQGIQEVKYTAEHRLYKSFLGNNAVAEM